MHHIFIYKYQIVKDEIYINSKDDKENYCHLKLSLRLKVGEQVRVSLLDFVFDYITITLFMDNNQIVLKIQNEVESNELRNKINLYQCLPKKDVFENIIDKSVELGIYSITPVISTNCVSKISTQDEIKKLDRFNKISKSSAEQSIRSIIPNVNNVLDFKQVIENIKNDKFNLLFYEEEKDFSKTYNILNEIYSSHSDDIINIIIGPEGGFTKEEIKFSQKININILSLGSRILRVETAALTALSYINYVLERI